jgi:outer membrane protein assembly factor BamD (BamD/ComL family)
VPRIASRPIPSPAQPTEIAPSAGDKAPELASLAEEVALLDRARNALVTGDPSRALFILDSYEHAKVGTTLSAEAALLRIEALVQRGETPRAAALAKEFLRAHPQSPVADRLRAIIQTAR